MTEEAAKISLLPQGGGLSDEPIADLDRARMLEKAVETMRLGVTITDPFGTIVYVNPADAALHGYERQELLGKHASLYSAQGPSPPTPRRRTWPWARARLNCTQDGSQFPVRLISDAVFDGRGRLQAIVTVCEDVSSRLLFQAALLRRDRVLEAASYAAERLLEVERWELGVPPMLRRLAQATGADRVYLLSLSPAGDAVEKIWAVPHGVRVRRLSAALGDPDKVRALCALLARGVPVVHSSGTPCHEAVPELLLPSSARSYILFPVNTDRPRAVLGLESDDPESPWADTEVQALGIAARVLAAAISRSEAAEALAASEANYRVLIESAADLIQAMDAEGRLRFANRAWRERLGFAVGELDGTTLDDVAAPESRRVFRRALREAQRTGFARAEGTLLSRQEERVPVEGRWSLLDDGGSASVVAVFRDLTEQHHLDRLKRAFIATASHELRTPLSSMIASLELLREARAGADGRLGDGLLEVADRNAQRLLKLSSDLLDLHKLSAGVLSVETEDIAVDRLLAEARQQALSTAGSHGVALRVRCSPPHLKAWGDRRRLLQVLAILLSNSILHGPPGQTVTLSAGCRRGHPAVRVRDRGDGIPSELQRHLFEEFVQADSATPRTLGGRGLGLALAHGLMRSMGGSLDLRPAHGGGTIAELLLPHPGATAPTAADLPPAMRS